MNKENPSHKKYCKHTFTYWESQKDPWSKNPDPGYRKLLFQGDPKIRFKDWGEESWKYDELDEDRKKEAHRILKPFNEIGWYVCPDTCPKEE